MSLKLGGNLLKVFGGQISLERFKASSYQLISKGSFF
jgi:hypothetical protein